LETISGDGNPELLGEEILWTSVLPPSPIQMVYTVLVPMATSGTQPIQGEVEYQFAGMPNPATAYAEPNPIMVVAQLGPSATHQTAASYFAGGMLSVTNRFTYTYPLWSLLWRPQLPVGWTVESVSGDGNPELSGGEILWTGALPPSPVQMVYTVLAPSEATGQQEIRGEVEYQFAGMANPAMMWAEPDALSMVSTFDRTNQAPILTVPGDQTIDELSTLTLTNTATDLDLPANTLTFGLISGPSGISVNPITGVLTWTPSEAQGPSTNVITVRVTDNGSPPLSDTKSLTVIVREVNRPPTINSIVNQLIAVGSTLEVRITASDPDLPANPLFWELLNPPAGAQIDLSSGRFQWTPTAAQAPSTNVITVKVTDGRTPPQPGDGVPALSDTNSFTVVVSTAGVKPAVTTQPQSRTNAPGTTATFAVAATGTAPLLYQWRKGGSNLSDAGRVSGATTFMLTLANVQTSDAGEYNVVVVNAYGSITSQVAVLTVTLPHTPAEGVVVAWGQNNWGQTAVPAGLSNVVAMAPGSMHNLALKSDGTIVGWGGDNFGKINPPAGLSNVVAVAAGDNHSLALKQDGTVVGWGYDGSGQATPPSGLADVVAIAAGYDHSLALKSDGKVIVWGGSPLFGQTNIPPSVSNVVAISAGQYVSLALRGDGTVVAWGYGSSGEANIPAGATNVVVVSAGRFHNLALRTDGTVVAWGLNNNGQTNVPAGLNNVVAIAAGAYHSLALKSNGAVVGWGWNQFGQTDIPRILETNSVLAIAAGFNHSLALVAAVGPSGMAPSITAQPQSRTNVAATTATFTVIATGTPPLSYRWRCNGIVLTDGGRFSGASSSVLTIANVMANDAASYSVVVTNAYGSVTSSNAVLTLTGVPSQLTMTLTVDNVYFLYLSTNDAIEGSLIGSDSNWEAAETYTADLQPATTYYLHIRAIDMGAYAAFLGEFTLNDNRFSFTNGAQHLLTGAAGWWVSATGFGENYQAPTEVGANGVGPWGTISGISSNANWIWAGSDLNVTRYFSTPIYHTGHSGAPVITEQPQNRTNSVGTTATFTVTATGTAPLSYQWRFNGSDLVSLC
jgi:hypothetical protein